MVLAYGIQAQGPVDNFGQNRMLPEFAIVCVLARNIALYRIA
jgi:hypothetical protein